MQEMALLRFLNDQGYDAKAISYMPEYFSKHHRLFACENPVWNSSILKKSIYLALKIPGRILKLKRKRRFDQFEKKYIPSTKDVFINNEELKKIASCADVFICGSDQIWNPLFPNGSDLSFYLNFVGDSAKKISYAASMATNSIPRDLQEFIYKNVSQLDFVSVRESSAQRAISELGVNSITHVVDPVFLLDADFWSSISVTPKKLSNRKSKYIFIYDFDSNDLLKKRALSIANKHGFEIIGMNENLSYVDKNFYLEGPEVFLSLVKNAEIVFTTSFHALAFSLIFNRRFGVFKRNLGINARMQDLLALLDLDGNLIDSELQMSDEFSVFDYDYKKTADLLHFRIKKSKEFLIHSINSTSKFDGSH
ncbi:Polysaccharide pyruvyl transferase [uncultured Thiomicrorhabdus sp.]